ncbi:14949_t:CDS:2, partial [Gigaspora rosea]
FGNVKLFQLLDKTDFNFICFLGNLFDKSAILFANQEEESLGIARKMETNRRMELQSRANQDYKSTNTKASTIGDRPDIMFTVKISEKALELLYVESGRCITTEKKVLNRFAYVRTDTIL